MVKNSLLLEILAELPEPQRQTVLQLAEEDTQALAAFMRRYFQIRTALRSGDQKLWQKVKEEQSTEQAMFLRQLESDTMLTLAERGFTFQNFLNNG